ncbi:paraquat-inducible protein A [Granulosicoccus antarcticus]|uniref:Paraquat-inducible protein A n=1 Tax=Granulosicoccus antarcticus IMCC3135 TaxID=1192854 RepID=A0A2Z2NU22_9GAMM|nr:paraquat-inducible protein A [Granulosicoccus antarcticus]ASJ73541.1 Paraquat-inducible protein A [Granulosicoccus antarcticus IMCC3135]
MKDAPRKAWQAGLQACHVCERLEPIEVDRCGRCNTLLRLRKHQSRQRTLALTATASLLMFPAHMLPIMTTETLGDAQESTIVGGVVTLWHHGSYPIALLIFIASVVVPIGKLLALYWVVLGQAGIDLDSAVRRSRLFRLSHMIGPWSMVDVFVVAILVGLVQLVGILQIFPGFAVVCFAGMVAVTMLAANSFDERLIWDRVKM